ncbi:MAG: hypothetical protein IKZ39_09255 [Lachnospiraceae bacterium]|nr:hypothetical protein [Lachnospiraceae bacterium]
MKKIKYFSILACLLCAFGCGKNTQSVDWVYITPDKPQIKIEKAIDDSGEYTITEYDRYGNKLKYEMYNANGSLRYSSEKIFDDNQKLISEIVFHGNGTTYKKNEYDKDGNLIKEYEGEDEDSLHIEAEYNYKKGLLDNRIYYNDDGSIWDIKDYEYDDGLLTKETVHSETGYVYRTYEYEYDAAGNKTKMTDTLYGHGTIEYYDLEGRVIKTELFSEGNIRSSYYEKKYGDYGITDEYSYDADGNLKSHGKTYYDEKGQRVKTVFVNENGKEKVNNTWEYDAYGNMIYHWGARGYETSAKYNEYGYPVWKHEVCTDPTRDAGTYDITTEYEYVYY